MPGKLKIYSGDEKQRNKQAVAKYQKTEKGRAAQKRANQKPKRKLKNKYYRQSSKGKTTRRKYQNEHYSSQERHERKLRYLYKMTLVEYDSMFEKQNGVCAICKGPDISGRRLCVDHNHKTEKIRGLLCTVCNTRLGILENEYFIKLARKYLKK